MVMCLEITNDALVIWLYVHSEVWVKIFDLNVLCYEGRPLIHPQAWLLLPFLDIQKYGLYNIISYFGAISALSDPRYGL